MKCVVAVKVVGEHGCAWGGYGLHGGVVRSGGLCMSCMR